MKTRFTQPPRIRLPHGLSPYWQSLIQHWRQYPVVYSIVLFIWILAYWRLFIDATPHIPLLFNWTPSLPYRVAYVDYQASQFRRGDYIIYRFRGSAIQLYPGLQGQPFFKRISGLPGDYIAVRRRAVFVNDLPVGFAKRYTFDGHALDPIRNQIIPADHYYVQGSSPDSFDSRYLSSGLVDARQIAGRVIPLF